MKKETQQSKSRTSSWGNVAPWYDEYLETSPDSYQAKVIAPNLLRMLSLEKGESVLDLASGQGYFSRLCAQAGAQVTGIDISEELIARAKEKGGSIRYAIAPSHDTGLKKESIETIIVVLAFENIQKIDETVLEMKRVLKKQGRAVIVLLHPAFRIPQHSDWGVDQKKQVQYRKVEKYLSEVAIEIMQNPFKGMAKSVHSTDRPTSEAGLGEKKTITYHRSLQWYMKIFKKHGFAITGMEEWISHKKSQIGSKKELEDKARKEIPLFLALELRKV